MGWVPLGHTSACGSVRLKISKMVLEIGWVIFSHTSSYGCIVSLVTPGMYASIPYLWSKLKMMKLI